ncbi:VOC family protein [Seongchinamella unica]|nr:VOC family protein [Seongchinamella unica]
MLTRVHHINLLVRDLDAAVARYRAAFAIARFEFGDLPERGVRTARFRAGESWIVLVQPTDPDSVPGQQLAAHGEGLFLLSLGVDSLASARETVLAGGGAFTQDKPRTGLEGWQVLDLDPALFSGALLQLTEEKPTDFDSE